MLFAKYILKDRVIKLNGLNKIIKEEQEDIEVEKGRFYAHLYDIRLALSECICAYNRPRIYELMLGAIIRENENLERVTTAIELKKSIEEVIELFKDFEYTDYCSSEVSYSYRALENMRTIDVTALDPIIKDLNKLNRNITVFEPDCYEGDSFQYLTEGKDNILAYGTEATSSISIAKRYATKVAKGELKGSIISNNAFDLVIAKCSITDTLAKNLSSGSSVSKTEKNYILNMNKYLRPYGAILFVIPYYRLHKDICEHIAKYYENVHIYKATGAYWQEKHYVYIYGQKSISKEIDQDIYDKLRASFDPNNIPDFNSDITLNYRLPSSVITIDTFKGSMLDMDELYDIVETSGCLDDFFEEQKVEKIGESTTKPLLPFNIGQLGLVLTSGCLDGIIDEGDGHYHLVKGKVSKKSETTREVSDGVLEESETISNRVEINVLLPNGDYKILT